MATIYDISKRAGVSAATVSRVLSGAAHPVKEETRQRILETAKALNYRPNTIARSLANRRTYTVALLIPSITHDFYTQLAEVTEAQLEAKGYSTYLCNTMRSAEKETRYVENLIKRRVDGVIFSPARMKPEDNAVNARNIQELIHHRIAVAAFGSHFQGVGQVYINTYGGMLQAVRCLLSFGHRRIGFIDGLPAGTRRRRLAGYAAGLSEAGIPLDEALIVSGDLGMDSGKDCAIQLLSRSQPPTALIAANNPMAIGAVRAVRDAGRSVPGDVSVIGFDDSPMSEIMDPPLSVVRQPLREIGEAAAGLLVRQMEGLGGLERVELEPSLILRGSCGPRRSDGFQ